MDDYTFIFPVEVENSFWCYSSMMGFCFFVEITSPENLEKAKEVAEEALTKWAESTENDTEYYKGYAEIVDDFLRVAGISHDIYVRMED